MNAMSHFRERVDGRMLKNPGLMVGAERERLNVADQGGHGSVGRCVCCLRTERECARDDTDTGSAFAELSGGLVVVNDAGARMCARCIRLAAAAMARRVRQRVLAQRPASPRKDPA